jgi:hypothetical protein
MQERGCAFGGKRIDGWRAVSGSVLGVGLAPRRDKVVFFGLTVRDGGVHG